MVDLPARSHSLPSASHSTIGPSTRSEPLGRTVILTVSDMRCALPGWIPASLSIAARAATAAPEERANGEYRRSVVRRIDCVSQTVLLQFAIQRGLADAQQPR